MFAYKKHFSLQEAHALLPKVKPKMQTIRNHFLTLKEAGFDVFAGKYKPGFHPGTQTDFPVEFEELRHIILEISKMGIEVKDLEYGLIDFPALRSNGEEVFLCWKLDEEKIEFWHSLKSGFGGRQPIDEF